MRLPTRDPSTLLQRRSPGAAVAQLAGCPRPTEAFSEPAVWVPGFDEKLPVMSAYFAALERAVI